MVAELSRTHKEPGVYLVDKDGHEYPLAMVGYESNADGSQVKLNIFGVDTKLLNETLRAMYHVDEIVD